MNFLRYKHIFLQLLKTELFLIRKSFWDKVLNATIWSSTTIIVAAYILPLFGINKSFGVIQAVGVIISVVGFELYPSISKFFADLEGDGHINYRLGLPLPGWLLLMNMACVFVVNGVLLGLVTFTVAKLLLWNSFNVSIINIPQALIMFLMSNIFFGFFGLFMISLIKGLMSLEDVFMRVMFPMWFLGGFQFTWYALYSVCPTFAYLNLLNPYIHGQEGFRAAMLGQAGYLPVWTCVVTLAAMSVLCVFVSITRLRTKLDFV